MLWLDPTTCHHNKCLPSFLCLFKISVHHCVMACDSFDSLVFINYRSKDSWALVWPFSYFASPPPVPHSVDLIFIGLYVCGFAYLFIHSTSTIWEITVYKLLFYKLRVLIKKLCLFCSFISHAPFILIKTCKMSIFSPGLLLYLAPVFWTFASLAPGTRNRPLCHW